MAVRIFRYGSLGLAILGVAVLLLVARQSETPVVEVGSLSETMNWAYVRIEGTVTRQPAYDPDTRALRLWVGDGTGEMLVIAYSSEAGWLMDQGLVPVMGDDLALEGTLRIKDEFQYLVLNVPQHTKVRRVAAVEVPIGQVDAEGLWQMVTVKGMVRDDRSPYEGLRILTLRDASDEIDVTFPTEMTALTGAWPKVRIGQAVEVTGAVDHYKGLPQISVGRGSDLVVLDEAISIARERSIGELSAGVSGEMVAVEGTVSEVRPFSAGVKLTLDDEGDVVTLLLWQDLYEALAGRDALVEGTRVRAVGEVAEYQGELEIVPELPSDVRVLAVTERVVTERQLGELSTDDLGHWVRVEGILQSLRTFSAGIKGTLGDSTGTVTLLLWQEVYDSLPESARLAPGAVLRVEGEVNEYRGELEVVPWAPADISVVGLAELPLEQLSIGQLTVDDLGQMVWVEGTIAEVIPFSRGVKYTLDDGTGTITLLLWQNVYDELDEPAMLTVTTRLAVRGEVSEYGGNLEVVPQFPSDIEVTGPGEPVLVTPTASPEPADQPTTQPTTQPTIQATRQPAVEPTITPTPTPNSQPISSLGADSVGQTVVVDGRIAEVDYFSRGVRYAVDDGTGRIILLVWQNVMEELASRYELFPGSRVRVVGEIDEYQGELEIIPKRGADVEVLARGERLSIEERAVGDIAPADEGRIFVIEGRVTRTEGNGWLRVWIGDGTGELLVFIPERSVEYLPEGIGVGVRLRIAGEVDIYQGQLEIIPLAGADVKVR